MDPLYDFDTERPRLATRIKKLKWDEISGVDAPANEVPGWLLKKSATRSDLGDLRRALATSVEPIRQALDALNTRLDRLEGC